MVALVDNESHWTNFFMKQAKGIFLKVMSSIEEIENYITNRASQMDKNIYRKLVRIQAEILPMMDETHDQDHGHASKCLKGF